MAISGIVKRKIKRSQVLMELLLGVAGAGLKNGDQKSKEWQCPKTQRLLHQKI